MDEVSDPRTLEVLDDDGRPVPLGGRRERALLAALLLQPNRVVSTHRLIDAVWGDDPAETAANALQVHISKLRKALGGPAGPLQTEAPGYVLRTSPGELDAERFEELAATAQPEDGPGAVAARLAEALGLWSGAVLDGLETNGSERGDVTRLEELRISVLERRIEADLALGRHGHVIGELGALIQAHPFRGVPGSAHAGPLPIGEQAEALAVYGHHPPGPGRRAGNRPVRRCGTWSWPSCSSRLTWHGRRTVDQRSVLIAPRAR